MAKVPVTLAVIAVIPAFNAATWAQDYAGKLEYQASCAPCHGSDGKGKGLLAAQLRVPPADLTALAKKNNGVFPLGAVYQVIDGRKVVIAHGTRDMPIWGDRFTPSPNRAASPNAADSFVSPSFDPEIIVRTRILAVIDYLNRIQEK